MNNPEVRTVGIAQAKTLGIQGLGGVGKSTLAAYFYHSLDFTAKFWADVSLKPDFTVFAEKIIIALGGKVRFPIDVTELINNLLSLLSQRRCLLVVDNLETLLDEERNLQDEYYQQFFSRWLQQGTNSIIFLTTQDKPQLFQGLQHWYSLGGMKIEEGIALLNNLAIQGTEAECKTFVEYVDGHPLTINLVAGFLREYYDSQLSKVEELGLEQFDLAYEQAEGLHRNKQDARLSWIIQQHLARLNSEQKQFLFNLSVYRLPFNHEAASYMVIEKEVKPIEIQKKLQKLCNRSLLIKTQNNYFQFESLVQKYIQQQEYNLTNAHQQAIEYYQIHLKEEKTWQALGDISEYLEIIYHHCELEQYSLAKNILHDCYKFLNLRGYSSVLVEIYENLIPRWQKNLQLEDRSKISYSLVELGIAYNYLGDYQRAIDLYKQSLENFQEINDYNGEATSLLNLASAYFYLGKYQKAIDLYQQSLKVFQEIDDPRNIGNSLMGLGIVSGSMANYHKAIDYFQQSLEIFKKIGNNRGEANCLNNLGNAYNFIGNHQKAIDYFQQSLEIFREIGYRSGQGLSLMNLGNAYLYLEEYQKAIDYLQQSLEIQKQIGDLNGKARSLGNLGNAYNSLEEYQQAIDYFQKSLAIQKQIGDLSGEAKSLGNLGNAYNSLEEYQQAIDYLQQSLEIAQQIGNKRGEADTWVDLGNSWKILQQNSEAKMAYENARTLYQAIGLDKDVEECDKAIRELLDEVENEENWSEEIMNWQGCDLEFKRDRLTGFGREPE